MLDSIFSVDTLWWILMIMYIPSCIGLIVIVLLQKGKGVGFAGAFGAGAGPGSDTVFGPKMSQTLPVKMTYAAAALFMIIAVIMSIIGGRVGKGSAPDLVEAESGTATVTTGLSDLGLGTGQAGTATSEGASESTEEVIDSAAADSESSADGAEVEATTGLSDLGVGSGSAAEETAVDPHEGHNH